MLQRAPQTNWPADCCRSSRVVLDLSGGSNVGQTGQTRWRKPRKFRQAFRSSERKVFTRCCTNPNPWEFEMRFLQTLLWGRFYRRLKLSFDQPSCMRCNEHNQQQSRLHSRLMQLSQRRRTLQRTGSTAKASKCFWAVISSPEPPKETVLRCTMHAAVQTRENLCSFCGLARSSTFISVFDSVESLSEKTLFASYSAQWYPIFLQVMLPKFRKKDSQDKRTTSLVAGRWVDKFEQQCQRPDIDPWDCMRGLSLLPFALVGRRIFPTTVDLCRPLPFPSSLLHSL